MSQNPSLTGLAEQAAAIESLVPLTIPNTPIQQIAAARLPVLPSSAEVDLAPTACLRSDQLIGKVFPRWTLRTFATAIHGRLKHFRLAVNNHADVLTQLVPCILNIHRVLEGTRGFASQLASTVSSGSAERPAPAVPAVGPQNELMSDKIMRRLAALEDKLKKGSTQRPSGDGSRSAESNANATGVSHCGPS